MQSNIKLIATDFDGTISGVTKIVSAANIEAIKYAKDKGVHIAVLSGRAAPTLRKAVSDFYNEDMFMSACNGALIYRNNDILYKKQIESEHIKAVCEIAKDMGVFFAMNAQNSVHTLHSKRATDMQERWDRLLGEEHKMRFHFYDSHESLYDSIDDAVLSIILFSEDKDKRTELYNKLITINDISVTSSFESNIEVMENEISKASALLNICSMLDIDVKDTLAIGDNYNDIDMIKLAGIGVAMGNADDLIKQSANFVTKTCDEDGFAYAVHKFI